MILKVKQQTSIKPANYLYPEGIIPPPPRKLIGRKKANRKMNGSDEWENRNQTCNMCSL